MESTIQEVLAFIEENDVKFIRLAFCDVMGIQKNISVMPSQIERVFKEGISFDGSAICGFQKVENSDLFLFPDASTLDILPWRPSVGRVIRFFCEIRYPDGRTYELDCRTMLKQKMNEVKEQGFKVMSGLECEFYLFALDAQGKATLQPYDQGGYLDIFPKDQGEDIRRDICLTLEEMGITPESSHHEQGPGQNEIDFHFHDALTSCDQFMTFRWVVETCSHHHQVAVSFDAKPLKKQSGSGLHVNLSLSQNNHNAFVSEPAMRDAFIAGILAHIKEMTLFLNPTANSYERFGEMEAPMYISWSHFNRSALIRLPAASETYTRIEVRSPDPTCNVYLASYLLICAGMEGITNHMELPKESIGNLNEQECSLDTLPLSLREAITVAQASIFLKSVLPKRLLTYYIESREQLANQKGI